MTRRALGRGLEALIPTRPTAIDESPPPAPAATTTPAPAPGPLEVEIDRIHPSRWQPRQHFDSAKLEELAASMRQNGVLQPLLVSPRGDGFESARLRPGADTGCHDVRASQNADSKQHENEEYRGADIRLRLHCFGGIIERLMRGSVRNLSRSAAEQK